MDTTDECEGWRVSSRSSNDDPDYREFDAVVAHCSQYMLFGPVPEQIQDFVEVAKLR